MMFRHVLFVLAGGAVWTSLAEQVGEDATCSAEDAAAGGCRMSDQLSESLASELDGVAQDIQQMCPLLDSSLTGPVLWALGILKRSTGAMSMLSLWPSGVHPETFADEYTTSVMTIIGRVLLGLYKTRDKSYVNVPTEMLSAEDILKVENIHAPHYDVDGNPNFYWFEAVVPKFAMRKLYVPLMTCFYSALRKLNAENHSLSGAFDDALNDPKHNTWEAVLSKGQSMRDWVMSFYDIAHTWDGNKLWPQQMTDFSVYFKKAQQKGVFWRGAGVLPSTVGAHFVCTQLRTIAAAHNLKTMQRPETPPWRDEKAERRAATTASILLEMFLALFLYLFIQSSMGFTVV
eukprot:symbB.v1.2.008609.t1/scaffold541.1/size189716/5